MRGAMVAVAQMGPIAKSETRQQVVARLMDLLGDAKARGCDFVVFPELALTTFFPRWVYEPGEPDLEAWYEDEMPNAATQPLFDAAREAGIGFYLGYAERAGNRHFNTSILVDRSGAIVGKYRKVHLPGHGCGLLRRDHGDCRERHRAKRCRHDLPVRHFPGSVDD